MGAEAINFEMDTDLSAKINTLSLGELDRSIDGAGFRCAKSLIHRVERAVDLGTDTSDTTNKGCTRQRGLAPSLSLLNILRMPNIF